MNTPDWAAGELLYVHLDERGPSVTLGFEWDRPAGYHHLKFLVFDAVTQVRAAGLGSPVPHEVTAAPGPDGRLDVRVTGPALTLTFRAGSLRAPDPAALDHVRRLRAPDGALRAAAAREAAGVAWAPEEERFLAAALAETTRTEDDADALAAQLAALPAFETALADRALDGLTRIPSEAPALRGLLARAARLGIAEPVEPAGAATLAVVRCLRGVPRPGLAFRTPAGERVVLERIEFHRRAVDRLDPSCSARVLLSGPGARTLGQWDRLDADSALLRHVRRLRAADPRAREAAADEASDWPDSWAPDEGGALCAALARAAARETDPTALESELGALLRLARFLDAPALAILRTLPPESLPDPLRPYLSDLLDTPPREPGPIG
ncbi:hypothetical protein [Streptomyces sp. NPDC060031]|uniref:hypothetical protein n=1 Tax=Streptomyces sp. NPDC060031 TaxID=3347043 RepID=UPI0036A578AE